MHSTRSLLLVSCLYPQGVSQLRGLTRDRMADEAAKRFVLSPSDSKEHLFIDGTKLSEKEI